MEVTDFFIGTATHIILCFLLIEEVF